jgi:hypothetical protein
MDPNVSPAIVCPKLRLIYVPVAKSASTSIKMALWHYENPSKPIHQWRIHSAPFEMVDASDLTTGGLARYQELVAGRPSYSVFTCVRHPLARLWSVYRDKLHPSRVADLSAHPELKAGMSFQDFMGALNKIDMVTANEHLRPQHLIIKPYTTDAMIFKVEHLKRGWEYLKLSQRQKGLPLPGLGRYNDGSGPGGAGVEGSEGWRSHYDAYTTEIAVRLYKKDLTQFGYMSET